MDIEEQQKKKTQIVTRGPSRSQCPGMVRQQLYQLCHNIKFFAILELLLHRYILNRNSDSFFSQRNHKNANI